MINIKNKNKNGNNINNNFQTEMGNIYIYDSKQSNPIETQKEQEINTGLSLNGARIIARIIAIIALLANFSTLFLNLKQMSSSLDLFWIISAITIPIFVVITIWVKELKTRKFSSILPGIKIPSQYVFLLNKQNEIVLTKLRMNCPKCNSEMKVAIVQNECYAYCKRNPNHNMKFDYTTLDNI